jgi:hypothetical protein
LGVELQRMIHGPTSVASARPRFIDGCTTAGRGDGSCFRDKVANRRLGGAKVASSGANQIALRSFIAAGLIQCVRGLMRDFPNAAFSPDAIDAMNRAMESAVSHLPEPVSSAHVNRIAESILRSAKDGVRDPMTLERMALLELAITPRD